MLKVRARLGTLRPVLALGLASTAVLGVRLDDAGSITSAPPDVARAVPAVARAVPGVRGVQTPITADLREHDGATGVLRPGRFSQVAVTWHGTAPTVRVSTHTAGAWTPWRTIETLDDLDLNEGDGTRGTDLLPVGTSDAVRVRVSGGHARELKVVTIDPGPNRVADATDPIALAAGTPTDGASPVATSASATPASIADPLPSPPAYTPPSHYAPQPYLYSRADWGADETLRKNPPEYNQVMMQIHVHHTASTNSYTRADVPRLIRGMYWYHTQSLGWNDIGYNYLIDRFGRLWKGRYGQGRNAPVRGAHTLGFNYESVGVSMIGNFETANPSTYAVSMLVKFAAWKADYWRMKPTGYRLVTSEGSDKYAAGTQVRLPVIDGHRNTNDTACPGRYLYAKLPDIRKRVQTRVDNY